jgi:hypothetical protein
MASHTKPRGIIASYEKTARDQVALAVKPGVYPATAFGILEDSEPGSVFVPVVKLIAPEINPDLAPIRLLDCHGFGAGWNGRSVRAGAE